MICLARIFLIFSVVMFYSDHQNQITGTTGPIEWTTLFFYVINFKREPPVQPTSDTYLASEWFSHLTQKRLPAFSLFGNTFKAVERWPSSHEFDENSDFTTKYPIFRHRIFI